MKPKCMPDYEWDVDKLNAWLDDADAGDAYDRGRKEGRVDGWNDCVDAWEQWEAERPGHWISANELRICSACEAEQHEMDVDYDAPCPNCGRKMEG